MAHAWYTAIEWAKELLTLAMFHKHARNAQHLQEQGHRVLHAVRSARHLGQHDNIVADHQRAFFRQSFRRRTCPCRNKQELEATEAIHCARRRVMCAFDKVRNNEAQWALREPSGCLRDASQRHVTSLCRADHGEPRNNERSCLSDQ
jgi:hypothetical protein